MNNVELNVVNDTISIQLPKHSVMLLQFKK